jgi:hypothetical protein
MAEVALGLGAKTEVSRRFYVWMAAACLAVAVLGFMPTYFLPMAQGRLKVEPIVHIHGVILFSWVAFFCVQTWLVARGGTLAHRTWGVLGVAIVTAMTFIVTSIVSLRIGQASLPGQPAGLAHDVRAFAWVSIGGLLFFVPVFVLAIANIKRPEVHKRLMLLGTISLLAAPIARWFLVFLAPPPNLNAPPLPAGLPAVSAPPVFIAVPPALVGDILLIVAMLVDWRTRGRPHRVYVIGGAILLLIQVTAVPVANSPAWQVIAAAIGHLAG